jgi:hypothetical protein
MAEGHSESWDPRASREWGSRGDQRLPSLKVELRRGGADFSKKPERWCVEGGGETRSLLDESLVSRIISIYKVFCYYFCTGHDRISSGGRRDSGMIPGDNL